MNESPDLNPYASPTYVDESPRSATGHATINPLTSIALLGTLRSFRTMMHVVGGIWIAYAILIGVAVVSVISYAGDLGFVIEIMVGVAILWMALGLFTCMKHLWALYVGLVLSYLSAVGNLIQFNLCGVILVAPTIIMAHVAIVRAGQLRRTGIPYNSKPGSLAMVGKGQTSDLNFDFLEQESH